MSDPIPVVSDRRELVDQYITAFSLFIKERCPDAALEIWLTRYEEEDAHIHVFPPPSLSEEEREQLADQMAERSIEILLDRGLLILAGIYDPQQRGQR